MIIIIDYGMGNLRSIYKALNRLEIPARISSDNKEIEQAEKLILPGVGHFGRGMRNLNELGLISVLNQKVLEDRIPILGICLGMQLFCKSSEEGNVDGLGWLDAQVLRFKVQNKITYKIPHIGWNSLQIKKKRPLFSELYDEASFYFVHSYHVVCNNSDDVSSFTTYEREFASAIQNQNIFGTQFHPEKSRGMGLQILKNFAEGGQSCLDLE